MESNLYIWKASYPYQLNDTRVFTQSHIEILIRKIKQDHVMNTQ